MITIVLLLPVVPIKIKPAQDVIIDSYETEFDLDKMVGQYVELLCKHTSWATTAPPNFDFEILALMNAQGTFEPIKIDGNSEPYAINGLYVTPKHFLCGSVRNDYYHTNKFIFRGVLTSAPLTENGSDHGDYKLKLNSWDIVYPVQHWELHPGSNSEYFKRNIFLFDYFIP
jgi:hypothetical protein